MIYSNALGLPMASVRIPQPVALVSSASNTRQRCGFSVRMPAKHCRLRVKASAESLVSSDEEEEQKSSSYNILTDGKLDEFRRLRSPRAARELALCLLYSGLVTQEHPFKILKDRLHEPKSLVSLETLEQYEHSPITGRPIYMRSQIEAQKMEDHQEERSNIDVAVLTAHPYVVYNKFVLSLAQKLMKPTWDSWDEKEYVLREILPMIWKEDGGRLLEAIIIHMAIAEIEVLGVSPNIVINEAVELSKKFCDGFAPRVVNGCLSNYFSRRKYQSNQSFIAKDVQASLHASLVQSLGWSDEYQD